MTTKSRVWFGLFLGSTIGGSIPLLWGSNMFSFSSIIFSGLGGIAGIYIFFKMG